MITNCIRQTKSESKIYIKILFFFILSVLENKNIIFYMHYNINNSFQKITEKYTTSYLDTVGENIIGTTKIRNNYGAIQSLIFSIMR